MTKTNIKFILLITCVALLFAASIFIDLQKDKYPSVSPDEYKEQRIKAQFSRLDGSNAYLNNFIKKNMNDPKSFKHINTTYAVMDEYMVVTTKFSGKNAFNGTVINYVRAKMDYEGNVLEIIDQG